MLPAFAEIAPGVRRIVAPNPSMMTGPGTNTYLVGEREVAVIDPGPAMPGHIENIVEKSSISNSKIPLRIKKCVMKYIECTECMACIVCTVIA